MIKNPWKRNRCYIINVTQMKYFKWLKWKTREDFIFSKLKGIKSENIFLLSILSMRGTLRQGGWRCAARFKSLTLFMPKTAENPCLLRTFTPIATAHRHCARKFRRHVMHRAQARALSNKMNNPRESKMVIARALRGFNDLGYSVTPTFLSRNRFYSQWSKNFPKWTKTERGKLKKIQDFCPRDI